MHFNNPIPRSGMPRFSESSSMRPLRDSGATGQLWKKTAKTTAQATVDTRALHLLQRKVEGLRRRVSGGYIPIGWHWASIPEYDIARAYSIDEVVILSDDNDAVTSNNADPGIYVCVRSAPSNSVPTNSADLTDANGIWNSDVYWAPIGGSGSGDSRLRRATIVATKNTDYLVCQFYGGSSNIDVAKSEASRMPNAWGLYVYLYDHDNARTSNNGTNSELQVMHWPFDVGDTIQIIQSDSTGVSNNGTPVNWIEVNTQRGWACMSNIANISNHWVVTLPEPL